MLVEENLITESIVAGIWKIDEPFSFFESKLLYKLDELNSYTHVSKMLEYAASRYLAARLCNDFLYSKIIKKDKIPFFENLPYSISISHAYPYIAVIIGKNNDHIGIDIELFSDRILNIEKRFLNINERNNMPANLTLAQYCMLIWSAKEATYKMLKEPGINFAKQLEVQLHKNKVLYNSNQNRETIKLISNYNSEYVLSICTK